MNISAIDWCWTLLRTNILLIAAASTVATILWATRLRSPGLHRVAWALVLVQGVIFSPAAIELEWLDTGSVARSGSRFDELAFASSLDLLAEAALPRQTQDSNPADLSSTEVRSAFGMSSIASLVISVWALGIALCIGQAVIRYRWLSRSVSDAKLARGDWQAQLTAMLEQNGVPKSIPLLVHAELGPMLCRTLRGYRVVVPEDLWQSLTVQERESVLQHELAHYLRGDVWTSMISRLLALPNWFNPMAWYAVKKFDEAAEWACDERIAKINPSRVPSYANVLLHLVEAGGPRLGTSAAGGASLAHRIRRLLVVGNVDTVWRKGLLYTTVMAMAVLGTFRFELVERPVVAQEAGSRQDANVERQRRLTEIAQQIETNSDPLIEEFKAALQTEVGQLVALDQIGWIEEKLRGQARDQAIPTYLGNYFTHSGELRDEQFAKRFVNKSTQYTADIARIRAELRSVAARVTTDSEENKLLKRFLEHESSAAILYFRELRNLLRPDASTIAERLGEVFVQIGDEFQVRAGAREEATLFAEQSARALKAYQAIREDVIDFAHEFADQPGVTQEMKAALQEPTLLSMIAFEITEDEDASLSERIDEVFEHLEWAAIDAAEGLVIRDEAKAEVGERLEEVKRIKASAGRLQEAVAEFSKHVSEKDSLHKQLKAFLESDLASVRIGSDYELSSATPEDAVKALISEGVMTDADGKARLREEAKGEFVEHSREIMRQYRTLMRKAKPIHRFADKVKDAEVQKALQSTAGKLVIAAAIRQDYAGQKFDGLGRWVAENFEKTAEGYVLLDDHREMVEEFLRQTKEVERELASDDF